MRAVDEGKHVEQFFIDILLTFIWLLCNLFSIGLGKSNNNITHRDGKKMRFKSVTRENQVRLIRSFLSWCVQHFACLQPQIKQAKILWWKYCVLQKRKKHVYWSAALIKQQLNKKKNATQLNLSGWTRFIIYVAVLFYLI